ncbi:MAG: hypothetical protein GF409_08895 [Candidatus Omnitrophica bacterium]|nr:hypothetical protein [Candidatus Omnitrophota bacterium]
MKKRIVALIFSMILVVFFAGTSSADFRTAVYKQTLSGGGVPPMVMQVWLKGEQMRIDARPGGRLVITFRRKDGLYNYVKDQNVLTKVPDIKTEDAIKNPRDFMRYLDGLNLEPVGTEKIGEYECYIYKYTDSYNGFPTTAWIWKAKDFPVKIETITPAGPLQAVFSDIQLNVPVSNEIFDLPENARFVDMSDPWTGLKVQKPGEKED